MYINYISIKLLKKMNKLINSPLYRSSKIEENKYNVKKKREDR